MRRLAVLSLVMLGVLSLTMSANAAVTGQVCKTYTPKTYSETICAGVDAQGMPFPDRDKAHAYGSGSGNATRIDVDYVNLWRKLDGGGYALRESNTNSGAFFSAFVWTTLWDEDVPCGFDADAWVYHAEFRFRLHWPNGSVGIWHILNSNDRPCHA